MERQTKNGGLNSKEANVARLSDEERAAEAASHRAAAEKAQQKQVKPGAVSTAVSLRFPNKMLRLVRLIADRREVGYQVLLKQWIDERLRAEAGVELAKLTPKSSAFLLKDDVYGALDFARQERGSPDHRDKVERKHHRDERTRSLALALPTPGAGN